MGYFGMFHSAAVELVFLVVFFFKGRKTSEFIQEIKAGDDRKIIVIDFVIIFQA